MRLAFVGDIALGDHPKTVGFGFRSSRPAEIPAELASRLLPPGPTPDLLFGNLEFTLAPDMSSARTARDLQCRGLEAYAPFLASAGVGALNVANNHSFQHGMAAFRRTVDVLRATGIHIVGTPDDFTDRGVRRVADGRVALLGWSDRPRQYAPDAPPYNEFNEHAIDEIARARRRADVVIASLHWGNEFILVPTERERAIARALIDAGATFVIGHHPHVLREVERYREGVIAYSLGNFVCDMTWDFRTRLSGWLTAEVSGSRVAAADLVPALIDPDYFPRPIADRDRHLLERLDGERRMQVARVSRVGYERAAEEARRRHARRTAWMMLRNLRRYPRGVALELFGGALSHRLRREAAVDP